MVNNSKGFEFSERTLLQAKGPDAQSFLQGLITNDIELLKAQPCIYSLMLTPQGKIITDMFISQVDGALVLDIPVSQAATLISKLKIYKLRADVEITPLDLKVFYSKTEGVDDPRAAVLGKRYYAEKYDDSMDSSEYHKGRIMAKIVDYDLDIQEPERFFTHELEMDQANAISYDKGCYVGQELVARAKYRGNTKKKLEVLENTNLNQEPLIEDGKKIGLVLGNVAGYALAVVNTRLL
jgi:folate-binding protein YgfZ